MNNGKICVSVCAETVAELIEQIKRAEDLADVIEIRFDCLKESEFDLAVRKISNLTSKKPFLATFRPKNKDAEIIFAKRIFKDEEKKERIIKAQKYRFTGWEDILNLENVKLLDFEQDILNLFILNNLGGVWSEIYHPTFSTEADSKIKNLKVIISEHYFENIFENTPEDLFEVYESINTDNEDGLRSDVIKIAVQTDKISDTIPIWKLLERAKSENKQIIPIAMGEAGKWTRILGLAHGAFMTYAALDSGKETAPGQVSAKDLIEVYRAKELDENTEVYGIIGNPVSQSVSPYMQNAAFKFHDLNAVYIPFEVANLDEFIKKFVRVETREVEINLKGFSVTIPHKQAILKHLDSIDEDAEKIGAVNTLKIIDGKIHGYNTDADGFIEPLKNAYGDLNDVKVAVVGNGGAARACVYALKKEKAEVTIFARNTEKVESLAKEFNINLQKLSTQHSALSTQNILVNATPLGMKGKFENETPFVAEQLEELNLVYDLVYNPFETRLLREADKANVPKIGGLAMLVAQGMKQFEIWTGRDAPLKEMSAAALKRLK